MQFLIQWSWLIPMYGLVGALLALPWATRLIRQSGPRPAMYINVLMTALATLHGSLLLQAIQYTGPQVVSYEWLQVAGLNLSASLDLSLVNLIFLELTAGLSLLAQIYGMGYLEKDWALARFFALMGFFEAAISGVILSSSLFSTYFLLEMLTLSTYLLVGFWYAQPLVVTAARDAFLTKRVGDVLLLMGLVALSAYAGSLRFDDLYIWVKESNLAPIAATLTGLALIAGPTGKCAQFPLHLWLDEAMEGPSPASILRNSAVVTCGAYVLIKLQPVVVISPITLDVLIVIGATTAIGASLVALAQIDFKRTFSYSTSAYIGLVFVAVGTEWPGVALLLLFAHAAARALIFMSIGAVVYTTHNQDLTELGGIWSRMPATTLTYLTGALGLTGVLPFGCFWAFALGIDFLWSEHPVLVGVFLVVNFLSTLNLVRVFRLVFLGEPQLKTRRTPEVGWLMAVPMMTLSIFVLILPVGLQRLSLLPPSEYFNMTALVLLIGSGVLGTGLGFYLPLNRAWSRSSVAPLRWFQDLLGNDFYTEKLYELTVVKLVSQLSALSSWLDRYVVDGAVNLVGAASLFGGESLKYSVSGQSQSYILTIVAGVGLLVLMTTWTMW
ncbi:NAD(P)H dehydrogenase, subunit NdhF3 family [Synechococcus sp. PCC 7335]|uniref:NAD(P)H-quinone oxidoreductase subunit F n=1 Tax=Synechococcus sp. (strain ATCC 29403 / PCC 7335) TaxID=91464 RepID=UPI00017EE7CB|nr:NAD(P)H-quinone oxidoreductase subunit F [Synechococcus sp. PCC 7335]EDX84840.1 NAD(P)H dehydrogenase, subunit NdhF3 family [Synechococcus sp. PCC 7335]